VSKHKSIEQRKKVNRQRSLLLQISKYKERHQYLEKELEKNNQIIRDLEKEYEKTIRGEGNV